MAERSVLITGAGIGIGRGTALAFAEAGYHVVVTDVLEAEGRAVADAIRARGGAAEFHALDVTSTAAADRVVAAVEAERGPLDVVIANAGIALKVPVAALDDAAWDKTFDVDLKGMWRVIRAALPGMRRARQGAIVCLSSIMGTTYGWDEHIHYSAAKAGVLGLVRGLAVEVARDGIRVNGIAPGFVRTAQALSREHSVGPEGLEAAAGYIPMGRVGEPADIASVALFLASPAAGYVTGQTLIVDGGLGISR
jgi:3-oxoacyl-[acyl-carrier protein] reductase